MKEISESTPSVNYQENFILFICLMLLMMILIVTIRVMAKAIVHYVKADYFEARKSIASNWLTRNRNSLSLIVFFLILVPINANAFSFVGGGDSEERTVILHVESIELYMAMLIDVVLLTVLLYLSWLFNTYRKLERKYVLSLNQSNL